MRPDRERGMGDGGGKDHLEKHTENQTLTQNYTISGNKSDTFKSSKSHRKREYSDFCLPLGKV